MNTLLLTTAKSVELLTSTFLINLGYSVWSSRKIMEVVDSNQVQTEAFTLLPTGHERTPEVEEEQTELHVDKSKSVILFLLENSPEFRYLSNIRQQVSHTVLKYYIRIMLTVLLLGMGESRRRQGLRKSLSKRREMRRQSVSLLSQVVSRDWT